jgi:hypothetical protein
MIPDIAFFLLIKIAAVLILLASVAVPCFVATVFFMAAHQGVDTRWISRGLQGFIAIVTALGLLVYIPWIWPVGKPRSLGAQHASPVTAAWNNVIDSFDEHQVRWAKTPKPERTELGSEVRRFELVDWNPPKHFYVTLEDAQTGYRHENQYVSKHCNMANTLKRGDQYNLRVRYFSLSNKPGERFMEFTNLYNELCGS